MFDIALALVVLCFGLSNFIFITEKNENKRLFLMLFFFIQLLYIYGSVVIVFSNYNGYLMHKYFDLRVDDKSLFILSIYVFFTFISFIVSKYIMCKSTIPRVSIKNFKPGMSLAIKYLLLLTVFCLFFQAELIDEFQFYISERNSSGIYSFFRLFIVGLAGVLLIYYINQKLMSFFFIFLLISFSVILKEKDPLFFILIYMLLKGVLFLPRVFSTIYLYSIVIVVLYGSQVFSLIRGGHPINEHLLTKVFANTSITSFDSFGPLMASLYIYSNDLKFTNTLDIYVNSLVPQFIFRLFDEERGPDLGQVFAQEIISNWLPGMGIGMSPLSEMAIYGILPGAVLYLISISMLLFYFKTCMRYILHCDYKQIFFIFSLFPYLTLLYLRGYSVLILKIFPLLILLSAIVFYFLEKHNNDKNSRVRP